MVLDWRVESIIEGGGLIQAALAAFPEGLLGRSFYGRLPEMSNHHHHSAFSHPPARGRMAKGGMVAISAIINQS